MDLQIASVAKDYLRLRSLMDSGRLVPFPGTRESVVVGVMYYGQNVQSGYLNGQFNQMVVTASFQ